MVHISVNTHEIQMFLEAGFQYGEIIELGYDPAAVMETMRHVILEHTENKRTKRGSTSNAPMR